MMRGTDSSIAQQVPARVPARLYAEAKRTAYTELMQLDFAQDCQDWKAMSPEIRLSILAYLALFASGTERDFSESSRMVSLVLDRRDVDELQCFTTLLAEKARFHDLFTHVIENVTGMVGSPDRFFSDSYRYFMFEWLEDAVTQALATRDDASLIRVFFAISAVTEGVLAMSGYKIFSRTLQRLGVLPTLRAQLDQQARRTESHMEFGFHIIEELVHADPANRKVVSNLVDTAFDPSLSTIRALFSDYGTPAVPTTEALTITVGRLASIDSRLQAALRPPRTASVRRSRLYTAGAS